MEIIEETERKEIESNIRDFYSQVVSYGYLDIKRAIEVFLECGLNGDELGEAVLRFSEDTETPLKDIDVCYIAYDYILQESRNKLDSVLGFDFLNEGGGTSIYVYGNYMCTSYDDYEGLKRELKERFKSLSKDDIQELREDKVLSWFLNEIDFEY